MVKPRVSQIWSPLKPEGDRNGAICVCTHPWGLWDSPCKVSSMQGLIMDTERVGNLAQLRFPRMVLQGALPTAAQRTMLVKEGTVMKGVFQCICSTCSSLYVCSNVQAVVRNIVVLSWALQETATETPSPTCLVAAIPAMGTTTALQAKEHQRITFAES